MAKAKKSKAKNSKAKKAKKLKKTKRPARAAKAKAASRKSKKPARKAAAKKAPVKKASAKKPAPKKKTQIVGEGDYAGSRAFLKDQSGFVARNQAKIPAMGKAAEAAMEGPDGDALRAAEEEAKSHARS